MISKFFSLDDSLQRNEKKYGGKKTKYFIQKIKIVFSLIKKGKISLPKLFNVFVSFYSYLFKLKKSGFGVQKMIFSIFRIHTHFCI